MDEAGAREALDRIIRRSGETYASVSRVLGRNPTYIQQYIRRGVPSRLEEKDVRTIARALGVTSETIGGLPESAEPIVGGPAEASRPMDYVRIEALSPRDDPPTLAFHHGRVTGLASNRIEALALIRIEGDAMLPAFAPGDELVVDRDDAAQRLRDGLYALRVEGELMVKRLAVHPASRRVTILSDNDAYPVWDSVDLARLDVVGRVVWAGRRFL